MKYFVIQDQVFWGVGLERGGGKSVGGLVGW